MSYDLFFYKQKGKEIARGEISEYLSNSGATANEDDTQWIFENKDTEVYFSFDYNETGDDFEADEDLKPMEVPCYPPP